MATERVLRLVDAHQLERIVGHRLMLMHTNKSKPGDPVGKSYYLVPGGYVNATDARKIIARPDVIPQDDGLFPGHPQTWKMGIS